MRDETIYCDVCGSKKDERSVEFFTAEFFDSNGDDLSKVMMVCHVCRGEYTDEQLDEKGEELHENHLEYLADLQCDMMREEQ